MDTQTLRRNRLWTILPAVGVMLCVADHGNAQSNESIRDEVSYTNDIRPIVNNFCTTCHAGDNPEGEFVLTSYEDVRKHVEKGKLLQRINDPDEPMPQNGLMPKYMRRLFQVWADTGYINRGKPGAGRERKQMQEFTPPDIVPVNVNEQGFEMLEYLQGHWVGSMNLMGVDYDWMAWDYRPIAPSHIHGIFEGGTIGNLFTSFFVTEFKGKRTIMARNGGMLNGIYRTSYFVLDQVKYGRDWGYYRLVDAYGGRGIMWMELTFQGNTIEFNAYTSRFGLTEPRKHMAFKGKRMHPELATQAAKTVGFPKNVVDYDFSKGLPKPTWADEYPQTSASYIWGRTGQEPDRTRQNGERPAPYRPNALSVATECSRPTQSHGRGEEAARLSVERRACGAERQIHHAIRIHPRRSAQHASVIPRAGAEGIQIHLHVSAPG